MSAPSTRKAKATYEALLDAAERGLADRGYAATTSTVIAADAGVSTGTFYTYFTDKDAVLAELFARRLDGLIEEVESVLTADNLLDHGLADTVDRVVTTVLSGYRRNAGTIRVALARVPVDDRLRAIYWERHARAIDVVHRFLRRGAAAGQVRADPDGALSHTVVLLVQALNSPILLAPQDPRLVDGVTGELAGALDALLRPA